MVKSGRSRGTVRDSELPTLAVPPSSIVTLRRVAATESRRETISVIDPFACTRSLFVEFLRWRRHILPYHVCSRQYQGRAVALSDLAPGFRKVRY